MKLNAVLLAAGAGRRFGGSKLTADYRGRPLLAYALDSALSAPVDRVVVVTGFHADGVRTVVTDHARSEMSSGRLVLVHAQDAAAGMAASLRAGLSALPPDYDGVFVFLGDMPNIPPGLPQAMSEAFEAPGVDVVAPVHEGRRGHPVLFHRRLAPDLLALRGDEGGRSVLRSLGARLVELDGYGPGVLKDVDSREASRPGGVWP